MRTSLVLPGWDSLFWYSLAKHFRAESDFTVEETARSGAELVELAISLRPQITLVDLHIADTNGIDVVERITKEAPDVRTVVVSHTGSDHSVRRAIRAGAKAFVLKDSPYLELIAAMQAAAQDRLFVGPWFTIAGHDAELLNLLQGIRAVAVRDLSTREQDVLQHMANGLSTKQIAKVLHVTVSTVESHRRHIMDKLGIFSVAQLTKYAIRRGITTVDC